MENKSDASPSPSKKADKLPPLTAKPSDTDLLDDPEPTESAPTDLVRVKNMQPRLLHLPDKIVTSSGPEGPRITGAGTGKTLQPGGNNVERAMWEEQLKGQPHGEALDPRIDKAHAKGDKRAPGHRTVREWIRLGMLVEDGDVTEPEGPEAPVNLLAYGVATAAALAEGEDDVSILSRWLKAENRPDVQAAIKRQIQAVGTGKKN